MDKMAFKLSDINEVFEEEGMRANCTCECGCKEPTLVLAEFQKLNNQCAECHYSHR